MKYYYIHLKERNGEREYHHKMLTKQNKKDIQGFVLDLVKTFYGHEGTPFDENEPDGAYWDILNEVLVEEYDTKEITKEEFNILKNYLSVIS
jgi:hypothetical protein